jgi:DNA-binding NarL/FixJ family response regulator
MIKIAIFDDHKERRTALKLLIGFEQEMECIGDYENCTHLVDHFKSNSADVVLMDIDMPEVNGIEGVKLLHEHYPDTFIIMQTVFEDDNKIFNSILAGAHGYILKKTPPEKLIEGIYEVVSGGAPMSATVARRVLTLFKDQPQNKEKQHFNLSVREIEVLIELVKGLSQKMVAAQLHISPFTVANHIKNIYQKLHVHSVSEAVATAIHKRIV